MQSRDCELRDARTAHPDRAVGLESCVSHNRLPLAVQEHGSFVWGSSDEGWSPEMFFPFPFERERRRRSDSRSRSRDRRRRRERRRSRSPRTPRREEAVPAKAVALPPLPPPTTPPPMMPAPGFMWQQVPIPGAASAPAQGYPVSSHVWPAPSKWQQLLVGISDNPSSGLSPR